MAILENCEIINGSWIAEGVEMWSGEKPRIFFQIWVSLHIQ